MSTLSDPGDFGSETFDVVLFLVEGGLRHEHREVDVLNSVCLEPGVSELLDLFPDEVGSWAENVTP